MSRRGVHFLAPESPCSPIYEGLKVHVSHNTIVPRPYCLSLSVLLVPVRAACPPHMSGLLRETSSENRLLGGKNVKTQNLTPKPI